MRVLVLGGGVIGVTTAYYLAKAGVEVTVVDRQASVAEETSFANAGQISPGYSTPWAAPGIPLKALQWLFQKHAPLAIRPDGSYEGGLGGHHELDRTAADEARALLDAGRTGTVEIGADGSRCGRP